MYGKCVNCRMIDTCEIRKSFIECGEAVFGCNEFIPIVKKEYESLCQNCKYNLNGNCSIKYHPESAFFCSSWELFKSKTYEKPMKKQKSYISIIRGKYTHTVKGKYNNIYTRRPKRTTVIGKDEIINLKIALSLCQDSQEFINNL